MSITIETNIDAVIGQITDWADQCDADTKSPIFNALISKAYDAITAKDDAANQMLRLTNEIFRATARVVEEIEGGFHPQTNWIGSYADKMADAQRKFDNAVIAIKQTAHLISTLADPNMKADCKTGIFNIVFEQD